MQVSTRHPPYRTRSIRFGRACRIKHCVITGICRVINPIPLLSFCPFVLPGELFRLQLTPDTPFLSLICGLLLVEPNTTYCNQNTAGSNCKNFDQFSHHPSLREVDSQRLAVSGYSLPQIELRRYGQTLNNSPHRKSKRCP